MYYVLGAEATERMSVLWSTPGSVGCSARRWDPKDVTRDIARDLSALVEELAALKGDANHWLTDRSTQHLGILWRMRTQLRKRRWWRLGEGCG